MLTRASLRAGYPCPCEPAARCGEFVEQPQKLRYRVTDSPFECADPVRSPQVAEPTRQVVKAVACCATVTRQFALDSFEHVVEVLYSNSLCANARLCITRRLRQMPLADSGLQFAIAILRITTFDHMPFILPTWIIQQASTIDQRSLPDPGTTQQ